MHSLLYLRRTGNGADDTWKFRENAVTHNLDDASLVLGNFLVEQLASNLFELCKRARLVRAHEPTVSDNIGGEDGSQATFHGGVIVPLAPK